MQESLGHYIHRLRKDANMTLTKLAAALDLDQSTLSKIENKKRSVPREIIPKLARIFNLNVKQLELEYVSEQVAEIIYTQENTREVLMLAEEKAKYFKMINSRQGKITF